MNITWSRMDLWTLNNSGRPITDTFRIDGSFVIAQSPDRSNYGLCSARSSDLFICIAFVYCNRLIERRARWRPRMIEAEERKRKKKKRRRKKDALATFPHQRSLTMLSLNDYVHLLCAVSENRIRYNELSLQQCVNYRRKNHSTLSLPDDFCLPAVLSFSFFIFPFFYIIDAYCKNVNPFQRTDRSWYLKRSIFKWNFKIFLCSTKFSTFDQRWYFRALKFFNFWIKLHDKSSFLVIAQSLLYFCRKK